MWQCVKCQENLEDSFDLCWNCGTTRDGVEDPSFGNAAENELVDTDKPIAVKKTVIRRFKTDLPHFW
jgi:uncharacterized membrane protein YvbJ